MLGDQTRDDTFLLTQFTVPPPLYGMVERARLSSRVQAGITDPVMLVCAPAGSGKTSLLSSLLGDEASVPVAWLSLEPGDDAPPRFWRAVLTALQRTGSVPVESALGTLSVPADGSFADFPLRLVNALTELPERIVLVLDDLHLIRSRECLAQLSFLVLHTPPTLGLVLSTRSDPSLPLHVLRVRSGLTEIRMSDLAFTTEEAAALLTAHGVELEPPLLAALCARTEGWAGGLRLAALALRDHTDPGRYVADFTGSDAVVGDYLVAEALKRHSPRLRSFLLKTSILDQLSGELADAVTGGDHGADTLVELERRNGFLLPLDRRREWFRYHRLFGALLRTRATHELGDELIELHRRAARWYAQRGLCTQALRHAIAGADHDLGREVIEAHWLELFARGRSGNVRALLGALPDEHVDADPMLAAVAAGAAFTAGDREAGDRHLAHAVRGETGVDGTRRPGLLGAIAVAQLCAARGAGDLDRALVAAREALEHVDDERRAFVHGCLGETALWSHHLERAGDELRRAITLARATGLDHVLVAALGHLALRDALLDDVAAARRHAQEAISLAEDRGMTESQHTAVAHLGLALGAASEMRLAEAEAELGRAAAGHERTRTRAFDLLLAHTQAELHGARGRPDDGLRSLDRFALTAATGAKGSYERAALGALRAGLYAATGDLAAARGELDAVGGERWLTVDVVRARLVLAAGDPQGAVDVLEGASEATMLARTRVERAVLRAVALDQAKDPERAGHAFEHALDLAEPSGHRWAFLTTGAPVEALLRDRIRRGTKHRAFVDDLLYSFAGPDRPRKAIAPLLEPLTPREEAILRYLPTRLSNTEMAAELFVTTNTVKTHLRSIYRKLDVECRNQAVTRARDLCLLTAGHL